MRKILALTLLLAAAFAWACGGSGAKQTTTDTPTEAYKRLFAAVKSKNTEAIRKEMSAKTQEFAKAVSARQKKTEAEVLSNGFTATTFSPTLPDIRDERVKDNMGAVEVWNSTDNRWEDLPFVLEPEGWKLAVGDLFANTYKSPGKGMDVRQREGSNSNSGTNGMQIPQLPPGANINQIPPTVNMNANRPANQR